MSAIYGLKKYYRILGLPGIAAVARFRLFGSPKFIRVQIDGAKHPIRLRTRGTDIMGLQDIFQWHEYLINPPAPPRTIVDAGANTGLTSVYFANLWPDAKIIAIEPEPGNFAMLLENTKHYPNITPVMAAVWKEPAMLALFDPGKGDMMFQTHTSSDGKTRGMTIPEIMKQHNMNRIDLLKMDIEGAELEVFEGWRDWIDNIGSIIIETHDEFKPGCLDVVMKATASFKNIYSNNATTHYMLRERTPAPVAPKVGRGRIL